MSALILPRRGRGYQSDATVARYEAELDAFCSAIQAIACTLEFSVSSRGWCYILEEHGLGKGDFDRAQALINDCRKDGHLPLDICAEDGAREFENLESLDDPDPEDEAASYVRDIQQWHHLYAPFSFWDDQEYYLEMLVEKIDLKSLFSPVCKEFHVPIANARGWSDLNSRAAMMRRFAEWEAEGKRCVLLYCGDHDPSGLSISDFLRSNLAELTDAVDWDPSDLIIDRFGLNYDFIDKHGLTWIDGLETARGKNLADPSHRDHHLDYVQNYLRQFGARKVEANALVVRPEAARALCREAILRYLPDDAPERYEAALQPLREQVRIEVLRLLTEGEGDEG